MAESILSFGLERLWNLIVRESERSKGFDEQFKVLKSDVEKLRWFLEDADANSHTGTTVSNTIKKIREVFLDAEDVVETFLLKEELGNTSGIRNIVRRFYWVILERRRLALDIDAISKRIPKEVSDMQSFGVPRVIVSERRIPQKDERRGMFSSVDGKDPLVGLEKNIETLVGYLVEEDSSRVVSITGMGGIGKTTLARQVFNHETIKGHFPGLAWVCVSQEFTREYVSREILQQLSPEIKVFEMTDNVLQSNLVRVLETQKALIVIDDIWSEGDWDRIKHVSLPKKGWKVLLTSRNEGVGLHADPKCVPFKPDYLTFEESWNLFQKIAFPTKDTTEFKVDEKMEEMGKQMIKCCGGLPLAVKVLGGLLAADHRLHEWERIYENIKALIVRGTGKDDRNINSEVYHVLKLSFEELPAYLKHCFLYLAHFPEDYQIDVEDLSYYWAAEGMPRPRYYDGASIRDVGDGYIEELVKRNMVISERHDKTSRFERCQLHDMMREVCLHQAEEENFVQIIQGISTANSKSPCKSRRLAVHSADGTFDVDTKVKNPSLRTLLFINRYPRIATNLFFTRHKLMRVLDLSWVKFEGGKVPSSIGKLIHLRYLSLRDAHVNHLPTSMRNLKQLLYLNLQVISDVYIPNFVKEMQELRYLYFPGRIKNKVKMDLGNLVKLETLENFSTEHGNVMDLQGMTQLKTLSINIRGQGGCSREALSSSLIKLRCLEKLTIIDDYRNPTNDDDYTNPPNDDDYTNPTNDDEVGIILNSIHLRQLWLNIYMPKLPDKRHFPSHLTTVHLEQCRLEEDPMPILEKLLHLKQVTFMEKAFCGKRMVCSRGGFPQLWWLELWGLEELEEWRVEEGSMPLLHSLSIKNCEKFEEWKVEQGSMLLLRNLHISKCAKLKELRDSLRFITSVKNLSIFFGGIECMRLSEEQLPSHLTSISLVECHLEEDPMPILEKLLHLENIYLEKLSFSGRRMVCSRGGFPQLQKLELRGLKEWEEWIVEEGSMPLLHSLYISDCKKLKEIPDGLRFITSLENLRVTYMGKKWKKRLSEGGEDYHKVQHISSVRF